MAGRLLRILGTVQRDGKIVHVVAKRVEYISYMLDRLVELPPVHAT